MLFEICLELPLQSLNIRTKLIAINVTFYTLNSSLYTFAFSVYHNFSLTV